jgi:hypothetical protein
VLRISGELVKAQKINVHDALKKFDEDFKNSLQEFPYRIAEIPPVPHEEPVHRALAPKKPFVDGGRGYRDALIWYTIVATLKSGDESVVLISDNYKDWASGANADEFHADFVLELKSLGIDSQRLSVCRRLNEFNEKFSIKAVTAPASEEPFAYPEVNYTQLLIDGDELVHAQIVEMLPEAIRAKYGFDYIGTINVQMISGPQYVDPGPEKVLEDGRRLLDFSARYFIALSVITPRSSMQSWSGTFSYVQQSEEGMIEGYLSFEVLARFRMIEDGENTESFTLYSLSVDQAGDLRIPQQWFK